MSSILVISDSTRCIADIKKLTDNVVPVSSADKALEMLRNGADVSIILIERPSKRRNVRKLIDAVNENNNYIYSTAILIITDKDNVQDDVKFLGGAVVDCLAFPINPDIFVNRVHNAERLISSVSFSEFSRMLKVLPANIYLKDSLGRYVFSSQTWHHLDTHGDPNWTIKHKTDIDIRKDKDNARKAMESDRALIKSGVGTSYIIEENDDEQEFLQVIKEPLFFADGRVRGIIALINDVTEQELMRRELKERSIRDSMTGAYNRSCFDEYVESMSDESFPVGIISADCDRLKYINDTYGHMIGDEYIRMAATLMMSTLPDKCRIFRTGGDEFIALIPDSSDAELRRFMNVLRKNVGSFSIKNKPLMVSFGCSMAEDSASLQNSIETADSRMYEDKRKNKESRK